MWFRLLFLSAIGLVLILMAIEARAQNATRGGVIAVEQCGRCHSVGRTGISPLPNATPFRTIARRWPPETMQEAFAEGIVTGHAAMPEFTFDPREIDDLVAYFRRLRRR